MSANSDRNASEAILKNQTSSECPLHESFLKFQFPELQTIIEKSNLECLNKKIECWVSELLKLKNLSNQHNLKLKVDAALEALAIVVNTLQKIYDLKISMDEILKREVMDERN